MATSSISKKAIPAVPAAILRRNETLDDLSLKLSHAIAIADVMCFANSLESLDELTLETLAYIQSDILIAAKALADGDEVRS